MTRAEGVEAFGDLPLCGEEKRAGGGLHRARRDGEEKARGGGETTAASRSVSRGVEPSSRSGDARSSGAITLPPPSAVPTTSA